MHRTELADQRGRAAQAALPTHKDAAAVNVYRDGLLMAVAVVLARKRRYPNSIVVGVQPNGDVLATRANKPLAHRILQSPAHRVGVYGMRHDQDRILADLTNKLRERGMPPAPRIVTSKG